MVVGDNYEYHVGREVLKTEGCPKFQAISGTLFHPEPEEFIVSEKNAGELTLLRSKTTDGKPKYDPSSDTFRVGTIAEHLDLVFPGWEPYGGRKIHMPKGESQWDLSVYSKKIDGIAGSFSESNCELSAGYTIMNYLINDSTRHRDSFAVFPKRNEVVNFDPKTDEPETFRISKKKGYTPKKAIFQFQKAYIAMRERALRIVPDFIFGGGLNPGQQSGMLEWFAHDYGLASFDAYEVFDYNAEVASDRFTQHIEDDRPIMFGIMNAGHDPHVIAVHGFMHYKRTVKEWWWEKTEWRTILDVFDGSNLVAFDVTQFFQNSGWGCFNEYFW